MLIMVTYEIFINKKNHPIIFGPKSHLCLSIQYKGIIINYAASSEKTVNETDTSFKRSFVDWTLNSYT